MPKVTIDGKEIEVAKGTKRAEGKRARKNLDAIVLNSPENFGAGGGAALWIDDDGTEPLPTATKRALARAIITRLARMLRAH